MKETNAPPIESVENYLSNLQPRKIDAQLMDRLIALDPCQKVCSPPTFRSKPSWDFLLFFQRFYPRVLAALFAILGIASLGYISKNYFNSLVANHSSQHPSDRISLEAHDSAHKSISENQQIKSRLLNERSIADWTKSLYMPSSSDESSHSVNSFRSNYYEVVDISDLEFLPEEVKIKIDKLIEDANELRHRRSHLLKGNCSPGVTKLQINLSDDLEKEIQKAIVEYEKKQEMDKSKP